MAQRAVTHDEEAQRPVGDVRAHVHCIFPLSDPVEIIGEALPVPFESFVEHDLWNPLHARHEVNDLFTVARVNGRNSDAAVQLTEWEWPGEVRHLICSPLSHAGASVLTTILHKNGSMFVLPTFEPVSFMQAIETHQITSTLMVPTMVLALIDHPRFPEFDLSSLEVIFYGASAFPSSRLKEAIDKLGSIFYQFYGQTEAPLCLMALRKDEHLPDDPLRLASCGRPTPWVQFALLDDDCLEVADGEPGEICVQGPQVMLGYLGRPDETEQAFKGGWLHTGDIAVHNPDGFVRIVDRKKDMIVSGGFNVFAREVEDVIAAHPGVARVAVIGLPDPKWSEAVIAIVVANGAVEPEDLIAMVCAEKGPVQAPKQVIFVDAIPLSAVVSPTRRPCEPASPRCQPPNSEVCERVRRKP